MSGKNEGKSASTLPSPVKKQYRPKPTSEETMLAFQSSTSNPTSVHNPQIKQHVNSKGPCQLFPHRLKQHLPIILILGEQSYEMDHSSPPVLQAQLQKIFSAERLNELTQNSLKIIILSRIAEERPAFHQMLQQSYEEYSRERLEAIEKQVQ